MNTNWPRLSYEAAKETYATLHLFTQIVGKIRLGKLPWINHSWHVTLLVTPFGLTTSDITANDQHFQIDLNFTEHQLIILTSTGQSRRFSLAGISVADFYHKIMEALGELNIDVKINLVPNEIADAVPFNQDYSHATYNPEQVKALHLALLRAQQVLLKFRAGFRGKCSPVHFFWGSFDLAVSRFSGREAPEHPGGVPNLPDWVAQEAYSHEVYSCGFWPGNEMVPYAAFYAYIYPEPKGFKEAKANPEAAFYHPDLGEFILPYETVQQAADPEKTLLEFLQSTYAAAADLAQWDRTALETEYRSS
jgi:hypothetical protein